MEREHHELVQIANILRSSGRSEGEISYCRMSIEVGGREDGKTKDGSTTVADNQTQIFKDPEPSNNLPTCLLL